MWFSVRSRESPSCVLWRWSAQQQSANRRNTLSCCVARNVSRLLLCCPRRHPDQSWCWPLPHPYSNMHSEHLHSAAITTASVITVDTIPVSTALSMSNWTCQLRSAFVLHIYQKILCWSTTGTCERRGAAPFPLTIHRQYSDSQSHSDHMLNVR